MKFLILISLTMLSLTACDPAKKETPKPKTDTKTAPKVEKKTEPVETKKKTTTAKPKAMLNKAALDQSKAKSITTIYRTHIRSGRKAVQSKRYKDGLQHFEAALKLDPNNPRALSELGWAAFLAGNLKLAKNSNTMALRFTEDNKLKGASLYNLGRVAEQEKKNLDAAKYYQKSLNARPDNKTVKKRLSALIKGGVVLPKSMTECNFTPFKAPKVTSETICKLYTKNVVDPESPYTCDKSDSYPTIEIDKTSKALIFAYFEDDNYTKTFVLAIQRGKNWYVHPLDSEYNPGAFGISESYKIEKFETAQIIPGGPVEILIQVHHERFDTDMGINEYESSDYRFTNVVTLVDEVPRWALEVETHNSYERDILMDDEENEDAGFEHTKNLPIKRKKGISLKFDDKGNVTIASKKNIKPNNKLGTFKIADYNQDCLAK